MVGRVALVEVPFNSSGTADGVARMPAALIDAGMYEVLRAHADVISRRVSFEPAEPLRGPSGLLAERSLVSMVENLAAVTAKTVAEGWWPLVVGGDCAVLLGVLVGMRLAEDTMGLLFVDGHEDAWPPHESLTGETADCELGIAVGLHQAPAALDQHMPLVGPDHVVVLGPRDHAELSSASAPAAAASMIS